MEHHGVYTKTTKGLTEIARHRFGLPRECYAILQVIDGKCDVDALRGKLPDMDPETFDAALSALCREGLVRELSAAADDLARSLASADLVSRELEPEDAVREWAAAKRAARALKENGYFANQRCRIAEGRQAEILVVEDDPVFATMEKSLLEREGFIVRHAPSGREAAESLAARRPDLVILDVMLPDTTGFKILDWLRSHAPFRETPVIMVTAQVGPEDVLQGLRGGADGYIFKPFRSETLLACLRQVMAAD